MRLGGLVLAAGQSRRFGADKRLAVLPDGRTVIAATLDRVRDVFPEILLVLRADETALGESLGVPFVTATDAHLGMAHSLAAGIAALPDWDGAAVLLGDMPFTRATTLKHLVEVFTENAGSDPIVVPVHDNRNGHPVIFASRYFDEMAGISGDGGARPVMTAHGDHVIRVVTDDAGVRQDIDLPADLPG